jgi:hypothetical protein
MVWVRHKFDNPHLHKQNTFGLENAGKFNVFLRLAAVDRFGTSRKSISLPRATNII